MNLGDLKAHASGLLGRPISWTCVGDVAQLGEHRLCKPGVVGSSPFVSTQSVRSEPSGTVSEATTLRRDAEPDDSRSR